MQTTVVSKPDTQRSNSYYNTNREPLLPSSFVKLPLGAVQPRGTIARGRVLGLIRAARTGTLARWTRSSSTGS